MGNENCHLCLFISCIWCAMVGDVEAKMKKKAKTPMQFMLHDDRLEMKSTEETEQFSVKFLTTVQKPYTQNVIISCLHPATKEKREHTTKLQSRLKQQLRNFLTTKLQR